MFEAAQRPKAILDFIVGEYLNDRHEQITRKTIAAEVFGNDNEGAVGPAVGRLRQKLDEYYNSMGATETIRIEVPPGGCVPKVSWGVRSPSSADVTGDDQDKGRRHQWASVGEIWARATRGFQLALIAEDKFDSPESQPHLYRDRALANARSGWWRVFWPDVSNRQGARVAIRNGVAAAYFVAAATLVAAITGMAKRVALVDVVLFLIIGLRLRKMSEGAAVWLLSLFLIEKLILMPKNLQEFIGASLVTLYMVGAIRGTRAHNRLMANESDRCNQVEGDGCGPLT